MGKPVIHPTAIVHPGAQLADDVIVGPYAVIDEHVTVGPRTRIEQGARLTGWTTLGADNRVDMHAIIGHEPQDAAFQGGESYVRIGDRNTFREFVTIHRGTKPGTATVVGNDCFLMGMAHLAHNCQLGNQVTICNGTLLAGYVAVEDQAFISGNCAVHQFVRIGRLAMVGGLTRIVKDVPPFLTTELDSAVSAINLVGLKRAGISPQTRAEIKQAYKLLYRSGLNTAQALEALDRIATTPEVRQFIAFIRGSQRGICRHKGERPIDTPADSVL